MTDITMCKGIDCNQKETCYRFMADADEYIQIYFIREPRDNKVECEMYWHVEGLDND